MHVRGQARTAAGLLCFGFFLLRSSLARYCRPPTPARTKYTKISSQPFFFPPPLSLQYTLHAVSIPMWPTYQLLLMNPLWNRWWGSFFSLPRRVLFLPPLTNRKIPPPPHPIPDCGTRFSSPFATAIWSLEASKATCTPYVSYSDCHVAAMAKWRGGPVFLLHLLPPPPPLSDFSILLFVISGIQIHPHGTTWTCDAVGGVVLNFFVTSSWQERWLWRNIFFFTPNQIFFWFQVIRVIGG